jgi:serine/threonine protein kinase
MSSASSSFSSFKPIQRGNSQYEIYDKKEPLGKGAMGIVYPGQHTENNPNGSTLVTDVAVKVIKMNSDLKDKIQREIHVLRSISPHPNVMGFKDSFSVKKGKETHIVLEKVKGVELFDFIVAKGTLSEDLAMKIFGQIVMAVKHCQDQDIVHRDLKPENIMIDPVTHEIKLTDFGMARFIPKDANGRYTPVKTSCGSPHYVAPEVALGMEYDPKLSDVWSLGVILYVMTQGSLPFDSPKVPTLLKLIIDGAFSYYNPVNNSIKDLINSMIEKDLSKRLRLEEVINHPFSLKYKKYFVEPEIPSIAPTPVSNSSIENSILPSPSPITSSCPTPSPVGQAFSPSPEITEEDKKSYNYVVSNFAPSPTDIVYSQTAEKIIHDALMMEENDGYDGDFEDIPLNESK